jgi:class 3 adenylate cyclase
MRPVRRAHAERVSDLEGTEPLWPPKLDDGKLRIRAAQMNVVAEHKAERRLAAILAADVAGYSRLVGADEQGTLAQWRLHWDALLEPKIKEHHGRIVRVTGDGILGEFASVVNAVQCAVELQRGMVERNADVPREKRIEFRIGINVGDIIIDRGDIWGEGVNVAARLEALAEPGGICVSGRVQEDVQRKLPLVFEDLGEQLLKNIARPVRVYRVRFDVVAKALRRCRAPISHRLIPKTSCTYRASLMLPAAFRLRLLIDALLCVGRHEACSR